MTDLRDALPSPRDFILRSRTMKWCMGKGSAAWIVCRATTGNGLPICARCWRINGCSLARNCSHGRRIRPEQRMERQRRTGLGGCGETSVPSRAPRYRTGRRRRASTSPVRPLAFHSLLWPNSPPMKSSFLPGNNHIIPNSVRMANRCQSSPGIRPSSEPLPCTTSSCESGRMTVLVVMVEHREVRSFWWYLR